MTVTVTGHHVDGDEQHQFSISFGDYEEGAARCGLRFNPDENKDVLQLKALAASLMVMIDRMKREERFQHPAAQRCFATAMTQLESGQMFAVKALFAKRNLGIKDEAAS